MRYLHHLATLTALAWAVASSPAAAAPGQLDPSFGQGGRVTVSIAAGAGNFVSLVNRALVQPDNKILILAQTFHGSPQIVRLLGTGAVDTGFGGHGAASVAFPGMFAAPSDMAIQSDGKIVVVGFVVKGKYREAPRRAFIARFNPDGSPDTAFGVKGAAFFKPNGNDAADAVLLQNDGKILIGDTAQTGSGGQSVLRLNTDGALDPTFGVAGVASVSDGGFEVAMTLQSDGKVIVGAFRTYPFLYGQDPVAARLLPDGAPDPATTGGSVIASTPFTGPLAVQPDGRYVINRFVGNQAQYDTLRRFSLANARDRSFDDPLIDPAHFFRADCLLVQPDGKVIAAGYGQTALGRSASAFELARVGANGVIDRTFGTGGTVQTSFPGRSAAGVYALALQADGGIVAAGSAATPTGSNSVLAVTRYLGR